MKFFLIVFVVLSLFYIAKAHENKSYNYEKVQNVEINQESYVNNYLGSFKVENKYMCLKNCNSLAKCYFALFETNNCVLFNKKLNITIGNLTLYKKQNQDSS